MSDVENSGHKSPGGVTGKGYRPGETGNPGGVPGWVKEARSAMRGGLYDLAARHLGRILGGPRPPDSTEAEDALYENVTLKDRTEAARLVVEYTLPKPKQAVGLKHSGPEGQPLAISIDIGASKP